MSYAIRFVSLAVLASLLSACGDAGDHFGEFKNNTPTASPTPQVIATTSSVTTAVARMTITMAQTPTEVAPGVYPVIVTAYDTNGNVINGNYAKPITISSNSPYSCQGTINGQTAYFGAVSFSFYDGTGKTWASVSIPNPQTPFTMNYNVLCPTTLPVVVTAADADAKVPATYTF